MAATLHPTTQRRCSERPAFTWARFFFFFFQAEDGIRDVAVTGVQTCALPILRRRARFDASLEEVARRFDVETSDPAARDGESVEDDRLRLIFTCCHRALPPDARSEERRVGKEWRSRGWAEHW